ncbi:MAG: NAD-dependent epimerase/dehydratase family protein [Bacteroidales bacterium]
MKILLTGVTGYIGKRMLPVLLEEGHEVVCCVRDKKRFQGSRFQSSRVPEFQGSRVPGFQSFKVSEFQSFNGTFGTLELLELLEPWNYWNFGTIGTTGTTKTQSSFS